MVTLKRQNSKKTASMYAVLGILALGPQTGYDIKKLMERSTRYFWNENYGQIYPYLSQLLDNGDVTLHVEQQEGKPDRKVYTITDKGRKALADWLRSPIEHLVTEHKNELLLRLFFGPHIPTEINIQHLTTLQNQLRNQLGELDAIEDDIRNCYPENDPNRKYWLITINYGKLQAKALIDWCRASILALGGASD